MGRHILNPFRGVSTTNNSTKWYRDSGRFLVEKGKKFFKIITVATKDTKGVNFTKFPRKDKEYVTFFGPGFSSSVRKYKLDDVGLAGAVTRLTCAREADRDGFHEYLRDNQFAKFRPLLDKYGWVDWFARTARKQLGEHEPTEFLRVLWVEAPHIKRQLRRRTEAERELLCWDEHPTWILKSFWNWWDRGFVEYKMKPGELLDDGKYLRAVGDLGAPAASCGAFMMDSVKEVFTEEFKIGTMKCFFCKAPRMEALKNVFSELIYVEDFVLVFFSDDACVGIRCTDGVYWANLDISQCDGSNYDPVFMCLKDGMLRAGQNQRIVGKVFEQCKASCRVTNVWDNRTKCPESFVLKPLYYTLFSGSALTTSINNMANTGNFCAIADALTRHEGDRSCSDMSELIRSACEDIGFIIKCQRVDTIEGLQFLKCSPTMVGGELRVFVNLGPILRSFGMCKGDLPQIKNASFEERASEYVSGVVQSYRHYGSHLIMEALRTKIVRDNSYVHVDDVRMIATEEDLIPLSALVSRYGCTENDYVELECFIRESTPGCGEILRSKLVDSIMQVDYGYSVNF